MELEELELKELELESVKLGLELDDDDELGIKFHY